MVGAKHIVSMLPLLHQVCRPFDDALLEYVFVNLLGFQTPSHMLYICTFRPTTLTILALPILPYLTSQITIVPDIQHRKAIGYL